MPNKYIECPKCKGRAFIQCENCFCLSCITSSVPGRTECNNCNGTGKVKAKWLIFSVNVQCHACKGSGEVLCADCNGTGHLPGCDKCGDTGLYICDRCDGAGQIINEEYKSWVASLENLSVENLNLEKEKGLLELEKLQLKLSNLNLQEHLLANEFREALKEYEERTEFFHAGDYFGDLYERREKAPDWNDWSRNISKNQDEINKHIEIVQDELYLIDQILNIDKTQPNASKLWKKALNNKLINALNEKAEFNISIHEAIHDGNLRRIKG